MIGFINWTPNETLYFLVMAMFLYRFSDTVGALIDDRVQHYYKEWIKK